MKKFTFYKQYDSMQCGIACLQMICSYYGKNYSIKSISNYCQATTEGVSLLTISKAAEKLGLLTFTCKSTLKELSETPLPCVLHWHQNHFVVLYKIKNGKKFYIADPGIGMLKYSLEEFSRYWIGCTALGVEKMESLCVLNQRNNLEMSILSMSLQKVVRSIYY